MAGVFAMWQSWKWSLFRSLYLSKSPTDVSNFSSHTFLGGIIFNIKCYRECSARNSLVHTHPTLQHDRTIYWSVCSILESFALPCFARFVLSYIVTEFMQFSFLLIRHKNTLWILWRNIPGRNTPCEKRPAEIFLLENYYLYEITGEKHRLCPLYPRACRGFCMHCSEPNNHDYEHGAPPLRPCKTPLTQLFIFQGLS